MSSRHSTPARSPSANPGPGPALAPADDERGWGASSGVLVLVLSAAAIVFERGGPPTGATAAEIASFFADHRLTLVWQSLFFTAGSAALLWFLAGLRAYLLGFEDGSGRLSNLVLGAGVTGTAINLVAQSFQLGLAMAPGEAVPPALFATALAAFGLANLPIAVMLAAVAVLTLRTGAFPRWVGWLSTVASLATAALALSVAVEVGPLAPGGWANSALYSAFVAWLVPTVVVLYRREHRQRSTRKPTPGAG